MAEFPLVSVIIPCYNRQDYIAETIDSVLNQTWSNIELIVVDDGCTDRSRQILESYGEKIRLMEHPGRINKGQSAAINVGLRCANGDYVAILDSDDVFLPEKIEKQVCFLSQHRQYGLVYSNGHAIDEKGRMLYLLLDEGHLPPTGPETVLLNSCFNLPSNALVRKEVFDQAGWFEETYRSAQDHDMAIRVAEIARVGFINECLWLYRRHGKSISRMRTLERWQNGLKILKAACRRYPYPLGVRLKRKAVLHFRLGQCHWQQRDFVTSLFYFGVAGFCDPARALKVLSGREPVTGPQ